MEELARCKSPRIENATSSSNRSRASTISSVNTVSPQTPPYYSSSGDKTSPIGGDVAMDCGNSNDDEESPRKRLATGTRRGAGAKVTAARGRELF